MTTSGKAGAFSLLAETAEEFIQLECTRRRNQASLKRQSLLPSQFHVSGHKSRLKEKVAQARRHAFLLRADNKAAIVGMIDSVRDLANNGEERGNSSQRNGLSPLERDRFATWATDVEKLLFEFEPSENHADDPVLRILDYLQFLQDGHVCLAEVVMDARTLLERWDRAGLFDSDSSSEDDDDDGENNGRIPETHGFLPPDPAKENLRRLQQSYAYQNVRQRAAASIIKRNVLIWVRSKASFCERVAEIEIFGRTTEALLKELSLTSAGLAGVNSNGNPDIFALTPGRPKSRYSGRIAFKDLLQFSKHMALYPVDQALRTVEDVTRRRYLFDSRCALKIQAVWRGVREAVRARRLRRAMEEIRLRREQEAQAKRDATKEAKKRKVSETGKRKSTKTFKHTSTTRSSVIASAISKLNGSSTPFSDEDSKESPKELVSPEIRESPATINDKRKLFVPPIDTSNHRVSIRGSTGLDNKIKSPTSTPRSRQRTSRLVVNNDSDDDTMDVEAAWKSFMDTVVADMPEQEVPDEMEGKPAPEGEPSSDPASLVTLPPIGDTWESWSDDELDTGNNENIEFDGPQTSSTHNTPSTPIAPTPRIKVTVSVNKVSSSNATVRRLFQRESMAPRRNQNRPQINPNAVRPPSSLPFDATLQNHIGPYTGAGQLSLMAPFIDTDRSKKSLPIVVPERKHLYELDFNGGGRNDVTFAHIARAFVSSRESEGQDESPKPKTPEKLGVEASRTSGRTRTIARLRSVTQDIEQRERARNLFDAENQESQDESSHRRNRSNQPGYILYGPQGTNIQREVVIRKGTMVYSPVSGPPEDDTINPTEPGGMEIKAWHRSTITAIPGTSHRPVDRFRPRHKRRMKVPQRDNIATDVADLSSPAKKTPKNPEKRSELPLLLRQSRAAARHHRSQNLSDEDDQENSHRPVPDATKQMWKRGEELPELVLAHIRDRVGYKWRSSRQKRMSIIAGRAPPTPSAQPDDSFSMVSSNIDDSSMVASSVRADTMTVEEGQLEIIYPVDEESGEDERSDSMSTDQGDDNPEEADSDGNAEDWKTGLQLDDREKNGELNEEFQQLHQASRERELSCRRSMLIQLQNEENAAGDDVRRRSKDVQPQKHKRMGRHHSQVIPSVKLVDRTSEFANHHDVDVSVLHYGSSDDDYIHKRRQLRVRTRDAKVDTFAEFSDDEDVKEVVDEINVKNRLGMTQRERDAAFQKLLTQYLGLLQCTPAEVAHRLQVNSRPSHLVT